MSYDAFMKRVDRVIEHECGLSYLDLPDYAYRDAYDDDADPRETALQALDNAGFPFSDW